MGLLRLLAVGLISSCILSTPAAAQLSGNSSANWVTAGSVYAVARSGSTVFLGGDFNAIAPKSQETGAFQSFVGDGTRRSCNMPAVHGTVYAVLQDPNGFYIGGRFDRIGDIERHNLARIRVNCTIDLAWSGTVNGTVNALASAGGVLFVGGAFTQAGQQGGGMVGRTNLASFYDFTGLLTSWNPTANGEVHALKAYQPTVSTWVVYAGGDFTVIGGRARAHFGAVDETGAATAFVADANARVLALDLQGLSPRSRLVVGGEFTMLAGTARNRLGLVVVENNTTTVDAAFDPDANGTVRAVAFDPIRFGATNPRIFAAGDFTAIGGASKRYVAAISSAGVALPFAPEPNGPVRTIAVESAGLIASSLYIGGRFTELGGAQRLNAGRVDPTTGAALGWNPSFNGTVHAIAPPQSAPSVAVGGEFNAIGAYARDNLAAFHLDSGDLLPFSPRVDGVVRSLVVDRGLLYVGGDFEHVDQQPRGRLASFTAPTRELTGWNPNADGPVYAMSVRVTQTDATVFAAGDFTAIGSTPRGRVAAIDAATGVVTSWTPPVFNATVNALTQYFDYLYVGGAFTNVGGAAVLHLTRLRIDTGTRDATWLPSPDDEVRALCADNNVVYAGGVFTTAGGAPRDNLVQLDVTSGSATAWQPNPNGAVNALACWPSLYAGGAFTTIGTGAAQQTRHRLAALSPTASGPSDTYATSFAPVGLGVVQSVSPNTDGVLVGARQPSPADASLARVAFFAMDFVGAPGPPTLPTVVVTWAAFMPPLPIGSAAVRLRWVAPARGARPTSYRLYAGSSPGASNFANGVAVPSDQFDVVAPLGPSVYYRVQAVNAFGGGPLSDEFAFTIRPSCSGPPDTPDVAANVSASGVTIGWTSSGEPASAYRLEASTASGGSDFVAIFPGTQTSVTVPAPPGVYYVRMRAIGLCGTSLPSTELVVRTGATSAPTTPPLNVSAGVDSQNSLRVSWSPPAGGTATQYRLEAGTGFGLSNIGAFTTSETTVWFTNVPGGTYYLRVYAIGGGGTSASSDEVILVWPGFASGVSPHLSPPRSR